MSGKGEIRSKDDPKQNPADFLTSTKKTVSISQHDVVDWQLDKEESTDGILFDLSTSQP